MNLIRRFTRMIRIVVIESWRLLARNSPIPEGWITPTCRAALWFLSLPSTVLIDLAGFGYRALPRRESSHKGAVITDSFVAACALVGVALYAWSQWVPAIQTAAACFAIWRIVDIMSVLLRMVLFHRTSGWKHTAGYIAAKERTVILSLVNYLEVMVCYGILYVQHRADLKVPTGERDFWTPLYFSGITQMTIGFGDVRPLAATRFTAMSQALVAILMIAIFVSRFVGTLGPVHSMPAPSSESKPPTDDGVSQR